METFVDAKPFVPNERFQIEREQANRKLEPADIDPPIVGLIESFARFPYCFTQQCCWGHFVHTGQPDQRGCAPLANYTDSTDISFQLAYVALCIEDSPQGRSLYEDLKSLVRLEPSNIQFGSAEWFWRQQANSYVLQVEPERFKHLDRCTVGIGEALHLEKLRSQVFEELSRIVSRRLL